MKGLLLSIALIVGLDEAFDHGAGTKACWRLAADLVRAIQRDVGESVFRS